MSSAELEAKEFSLGKQVFRLLPAKDCHDQDLGLSICEKVALIVFPWTLRCII